MATRPLISNEVLIRLDFRYLAPGAAHTSAISPTSNCLGKPNPTNTGTCWMGTHNSEFCSETLQALRHQRTSQYYICTPAFNVNIRKEVEVWLSGSQYNPDKNKPNIQRTKWRKSIFYNRSYRLSNHILRMLKKRRLLPVSVYPAHPIKPVKYFGQLLSDIAEHFRRHTDYFRGSRELRRARIQSDCPGRVRRKRISRRLKSRCFVLPFGLTTLRLAASDRR